MCSYKTRLSFPAPELAGSDNSDVAANHLSGDSPPRGQSRSSVFHISTDRRESMGALLIHIAGNNWVADVANTNVQYAFVGADAQAQVGAVQQLAAAMQQGEAALVNGIDEIFV